MEGKYKLKVTKTASNDLDQIYSYIAKELSAEMAADNLMGKIEKQLLRLCDYPYSNTQLTDGIVISKGYYRLPIENYLVFYIVDELDKSVIIMRVIFGARNYERFL